MRKDIVFIFSILIIFAILGNTIGIWYSTELNNGLGNFNAQLNGNNFGETYSYLVIFFVVIKVFPFFDRMSVKKHARLIIKRSNKIFSSKILVIVKHDVDLIYSGKGYSLTYNEITLMDIKLNNVENAYFTHLPIEDSDSFSVALFHNFNIIQDLVMLMLLLVFGFLLRFIFQSIIPI